LGPHASQLALLGKAELRSWGRLWYAGRVLGLTHGELFIVVFVFLAVVLAPYSARAGQRLFALFGPSVNPRQRK
jgi:hypothetical protein